MTYLLTIIVGLNGLALVSLLVRQLERRWPVEWNDREVVSDWKVTCTNLFIAKLAEPLTGACAAGIISTMGGGFIHLRADGIWYVISLICLILVGDLFRYWHHRLEHMIPFLWALHSFHHSAKTVSFITGARHHWIDHIITGAFLPVMPILFDVPSSIAVVVGFIYFLPDGCAHLNIRFSMGRAITWINNPQWHRIHHSVRVEHHDKNFAALLPLWDILFKTAWIPGPDEYPATGLASQDHISFVDGIIWPFRKRQALRE